MPFTKPNKILNKWVIHIIFWVSTGTFSYSQDLYDHELNKNKWEDIKNGVEYKPGQESQWQSDSWNETKWGTEDGEGNSSSGNGSGKNKSNKVGEGESSQEYQEPRNGSNVNWPNMNFSGLGWIGWLIVIIIGLALIALIVYIIIDNQSKGKTEVRNLNTDEFENIAPSEIPLTELQKKLNEALSQKNYRQAIRIYYLFILKDLSQRQWIEWEREKTNMNYLHEMSSKSEYPLFSQAVDYYDYVWYGEKPINEVIFTKIQPTFTQLLTRLDIK